MSYTFSKISTQYANLNTVLNQACEQLKPTGLAVSEVQKQQLLYYLDQLLLWNKAYNLTAIKDPKEALIKHIFDCLAILPLLPPSEFHKILDIGTGAGLPSVIIAICQPDRLCIALDSNQKKIRFIRQIASELALNNLHPVADRIENHLKDHQGDYDVITSRAFASLDDFIKVSAPLLKPNYANQAGGKICAMKGKAPSADELAIWQDAWYIQVQKIHVPFLPDDRHWIEMIKK